MNYLSWFDICRWNYIAFYTFLFTSLYLIMISVSLRVEVKGDCTIACYSTCEVQSERCMAREPDPFVLGQASNFFL